MDMPARWFRGAAAIVLGGALPVAGVAMQAPAAYGKLPSSFEVNDGQVDRAVKFLCRGRGHAIFLTATEAVVSLGAGSLQPANGGGYDAFVVKIGATGTPCAGDPATSICLNGSRFQVTATFDGGGGNAGAAHAVQLTSDTGYLWFFSSANVELVVKVLNGCGLDGHYWVFAGGLTDVNVVLSVVDLQNGTLRTYVNPPHTPFQPIQDTSAFAACP